MTYILCAVCGTKVNKGMLEKHLRMEHNFDLDDYEEYEDNGNDKREYDYDYS